MSSEPEPTAEALAEAIKTDDEAREQLADAIVDRMDVDDTTAEGQGAQSYRRDVLKALGVAGLGGAAFLGGSQTARAGDNQTGTVNGPLDWEVEDVFMREMSELETPDSDYQTIGMKSDGLYRKLPDGTEESVGGGGGLSDGDDFDGQGTSEFTDLQSLNTENLRNEIATADIQTAWDGLVVPIADGLGASDAVDPASTNTPLQDAADAADAAGGGVVLLPAVEIDEEGPFNQPDNVSIIGHGGGVSAGSEPVSAVKITNPDSENGIELDGSDNWNWVDWVLLGDGPTGTATTALHNDGSSVNNVYIDRWGVKDWRGKGVHMEEEFFQTRIGRIAFRSIDAGDQNAVVRLGAGGPDFRIHELVCYPDDEDTSEDSAIVYIDDDTFGQLQIHQMNIGGYPSTLINQPPTSAWNIKVGWVNVEPFGSNSSTGAMFFVGNTEKFVVDSVWAHDNNDEFDYQRLVDYKSENGVFEIGQPEYKSGADFDFEPVRIDADTGDGSVIYHGFVDDVDNNTGSTLSNPVVTLADVTKKVSDGVGYDGGTDDSQL